jgi:hypothetical protein
VNPTRPSLLTLAGAGMIVALTVVGIALRPIVPWNNDPSPPEARHAPEGSVSGDGFAVWDRTHDGRPLRWDACRPIDLVLSLQDAPPAAEEDVRDAVSRIAAASGLQLRVSGPSDERPSAVRALTVREGGAWRWNPVLVAWMTPEEAQHAGIPLAAQDRGVALPVAVRDGDREGYVTGQVVLNAARTDLRGGFADRSDAWGATLLHELGHLVGLAHVEDPQQMMSTAPGSGPIVLGPGDLAGLELLGARAGCTAVPDPAVGRGLAPPVPRVP